MPFVNLAVAQGAAAWIAAPNLVHFVLDQGPEFNLAVAAVSAVIVLIGAFIGSRITETIVPPTLLSLVAAVSFAIIAAAAVETLIGVRATQSELAAHAFTFAPVAAAILGYFYAARRRAV